MKGKLETRAGSRPVLLGRPGLLLMMLLLELGLASACARRGVSFERAGVPALGGAGEEASLIVGWAREPGDRREIEALVVDGTVLHRWSPRVQRPAVVSLASGQHQVQVLLRQRRPDGSWRRKRTPTRAVRVRPGEARLCPIRLTGRRRERAVLSCLRYLPPIGAQSPNPSERARRRGRPRGDTSRGAIPEDARGDEEGAADRARGGEARLRATLPALDRLDRLERLMEALLVELRSLGLEPGRRNRLTNESLPIDTEIPWAAAPRH